MKKRIIIIAAVIAAAFVSCQKDDTIRYGNVTMGNIVDGEFISDQGNTFHIAEQACEGNLMEFKRAIINCDVLRETSEGVYDIRLLEMLRVLAKDPVAASSAVEEDILVEDPVSIYNLWYAGGYINMYVVFPIKENSGTTHLINLIYDDSAETEGKYSFTLRHNAYGDKLTDADRNLILAGAYVSFYVADLIKEDEAKVNISWKWYKSAETGLTSTIEDNTTEFDWKRGAFEQAPSAIGLKSPKAVR